MNFRKIWIALVNINLAQERIYRIERITLRQLLCAVWKLWNRCFQTMKIAYCTCSSYMIHRNLIIWISITFWNSVALYFSRVEVWHLKSHKASFSVKDSWASDDLKIETFWSQEKQRSLWLYRWWKLQYNTYCKWVSKSVHFPEWKGNGRSPFPFL